LTIDTGPAAGRRPRTHGFETQSIGVIPDDERHGRIRDQFTLWFGFNANIFFVVLGGVSVFIGLNVLWAVITIVVGVLAGMILVGFHAIQGPKLGVPQMIQSRGQFGFYGAVLVFAASIALDFGFLAAQLVIQAEAMHLLVGSISIPVWIAVLTIPVLVLTIYGYDWIHRWQRWMTVVLTVTFVIVIVQALSHGTPSGAAAGTGAPSFALFMGGTGLWVIGMVSWAPYVSDYSRYLPATVDAGRTFGAVLLGCAVPAVVCGSLGAYLTGLLPDEPSTVAAMSDVCGTWVLPIMALSLVGGDVADAYTGTLALVSIVSCFKDVRRSALVRVLCSVLVVAAGTLSALIGYRHFVPNLSNFLNVLLYVFVPWSAINLTDYYIVSRGKYDIPSFFTATGRYGGVLWRGLGSYLLAVAVEIPFIDQSFYRGPLVTPLHDTDVSWVVGGLAGTLVYLVGIRCGWRPRRSRPGSGGSRRGCGQRRRRVPTGPCGPR
jgi:NCS1 family nucleobase:cation symporter-1